ncbi:hypothetical protein Tco_0874857 [Tanacetum coccineum]|uniref:Uncharacterized protein n=1 Tax=Tanacetum coccineum TaxID=301880 RepID=A0ABQ5BN62_9ASTR
METIHVKFDELTTMAFECNNLGLGFNCSNIQDSSEDLNKIPLKEDLDNLFDTLSSSSIIVEEHEAPQLVSSSEKPIDNEPTTPVSENHSDELVQEDILEIDDNTFMNPFHTPVLEEAESSSTYQDPSNIYEFYQKHRSTNIWTENHPLDEYYKTNKHQGSYA